MYVIKVKSTSGDVEIIINRDEALEVFMILESSSKTVNFSAHFPGCSEVISQKAFGFGHFEKYK